MTDSLISSSVPPALAGDTPREAPVADWVSMSELYADPFPTFERLRAEGGVHWVPAVGRYLVTSYAAVHATELDQEVFSANEEGSLMIRAMGHSMLRRDDPEHRIERKAWEPALRPGVVKRVWAQIFERNAQTYLDRLVAAGPGADLVEHFAAPYAAENLRLVSGLYNASQEDIQRWSQTMIDATGNYADDPEVWAAGQRSFDEVDTALDEMLIHHAKNRDASLISQLLAIPDYEMPLDRIRANLKMTIGGGLNEPRDAIAVAVHALLGHPDQRAAVAGDPSLWPRVMDETIRWVAPIGMYSRQTTRDTVLEGVVLPAGARLGICLLSANRDERVWEAPQRFDITREVKPHLAFGKGVHVCAGAWVARSEVADVALPALFHRLPDLAPVEGDPAVAGGWVFRGMTRLPVTWTTVTPGDRSRSGGQVEAPAPHVAIVGSGPSGSYTAQALRRAFPQAALHVFDRLPTPYGLVRSGVAADHQGTKSVARQFERLYTAQGVDFHGNVDITTPDQLARLREEFDAVVLATGLRGDRRLGVPGDDLPGIHGAGRITRCLNAHADEPAVPSLGGRCVVIGHGNVAIDIVRLLAREDDGFAGTDIDDAARRVMAGDLRVIHVVGRSLPQQAKFDPVMLRELAALDGIDHVVHLAGDARGLNPEDAEDTGPAEQAQGAGAGADARVDAVAALTAARRPDARIRVEWWFGLSPARIDAAETVDATGSSGERSGSIGAVVFTGPDGEVRLETDSVVTAVGFCSEGDQLVEPAAHPDGRAEPGLYVAGWLRRGPRGTIPDQRADARGLAQALAQDISSGAVRLAPGRPDYAAPKGATTFDQWRRIDHLERLGAEPGRVRAKLRSLEEMLAATRRDDLASPIDAAENSRALPLPPCGVTVLVGTESGNAELVAQQLVADVEAARGEPSDATDAAIALKDLGEVRPADLDPARLHVLVCSSYGDGELPTNAREFHQELTASRPDLTGMRFAVFGLGDRSYSRTYSRGSEILAEAFEACGAHRVGEYGRHDAGGGEDASELASEWFAALLAEVAEADATTSKTVSTVSTDR